MAENALISEVIKVVCILLVLPATNSESERSYSSMRRLKTYLRSTIHQRRLNSLIIACTQTLY